VLANSVETPYKFHCQQRRLSSKLANFFSNVRKRAQISCSCCTAYLRSTTIVTRLTEHDDVIKSLLRGSPRPGLALGPEFTRAGPVRTLAGTLLAVASDTQAGWDLWRVTLRNLLPSIYRTTPILSTTALTRTATRLVFITRKRQTYRRKESIGQTDNRLACWTTEKMSIKAGLPTCLHQKKPDLVTKNSNSKHKMDTVLQLLRDSDVMQFQFLKNIFFSRDCHTFVSY